MPSNVQADPDPDTAAAPPAPAPEAATRAVSQPTPAGSFAPPPDPYANYEWKGLNVKLPPPPDTIDGNLFGLRQRIADNYGIGYYGLSVSAFYDNSLRHDHSGPQTYIGDKPTVLSQNIFVVTLDLSRYGIPDGQFVVGTSHVATSWNAIGQNEINLGQLSYYQTLFDKRVEIKAGPLGNVLEFVDELTGGNFAGGVFGPSGSLLPETGGSAAFYSTHEVNVTGHITKHLYDKIGVARAVSPLGVVEEHNFNPTGTRFSTPQSGVRAINELGYLQPAEPEIPQTWIRAGGVFSGAHYTELDHSPLTAAIAGIPRPVRRVLHRVRASQPKSVFSIL